MPIVVLAVLDLSGSRFGTAELGGSFLRRFSPVIDPLAGFETFLLQALLFVIINPPSRLPGLFFLLIGVESGLGGIRVPFKLAEKRGRFSEDLGIFKLLSRICLVTSLVASAL